jgi:hypothetical protein
VIYAKLTSTGAYEVVARTAHVSLDDARTLAERLLPGNPPLDAAVGEEVAHLRPPEGGHIVWRFARYGWSDGGRGDVFITDITMVFRRRLQPRPRRRVRWCRGRTRCSGATELPPFTVPAGDAAAEQARITRLHALFAADARTVVAGSAAADPALLIHTGERAGALELFTLLLPPRLRASLTFQTQAFRVPPVLPRITLVDRGYANLRDAPWKVLPSLDVDVPLELAGRFVALAGNPQALELAHSLYEDASDDVPGIRAGIARLVSLADRHPPRHPRRGRRARATSMEPALRAAVLAGCS